MNLLSIYWEYYPIDINQWRILMARIVIGLLLLASYLVLGNNVKESPEAFSNSERGTMVESFMSGLEAQSPKQAVDLWLLGVNNHSGALQYATLSPDLQEKTKIEFEKKGWETGQSSPWLENVHIVKEEKINGTTMEYTLEYDLASTNWQWNKKGRKFITVVKNPDRLKHWYIAKITSNYNKYEAFTPAEKVNRILEPQ